MRSIDLTPYPTQLDETDAAGRPTGHKLMFQVGASLIELLFVGQHPPRQVVRRAQLADRIEEIVTHSAGGASIALEEEEWRWIVEALETAKPTGRQFAEFISRILDATAIPASRGLRRASEFVTGLSVHPLPDAVRPFDDLHPQPIAEDVTPVVAHTS